MGINDHQLSAPKRLALVIHPNFSSEYMRINDDDHNSKYDRKTAKNIITPMLQHSSAPKQTLLDQNNYRI